MHQFLSDPDPDDPGQLPFFGTRCLKPSRFGASRRKRRSQSRQSSKQLSITEPQLPSVTTGTQLDPEPVAESAITADVSFVIA